MCLVGHIKTSEMRVCCWLVLRQEDEWVRGGGAGEQHGGVRGQPGYYPCTSLGSHEGERGSSVGTPPLAHISLFHLTIGHEPGLSLFGGPAM